MTRSRYENSRKYSGKNKEPGPGTVTQLRPISKSPTAEPQEGKGLASPTVVQDWQLATGYTTRKTETNFRWQKPMFLKKPMKTTMMIFSGTLIGLILTGVFGWNLIARGAYESAEYKVIESDGKFEIREYPDLMLAATTTKSDLQGRDGSFMQLFRYISGANESKQKISMTTPVFMENQSSGERVQMGFVMPKEVADQGVPKPTGEKVEVRKRDGGRFAVVRFSGTLNAKSAKDAETRLREWMQTKGLEPMPVGESNGVETAGYDPPFTPGPLRRNEVLIRIR